MNVARIPLAATAALTLSVGSILAQDLLPKAAPQSRPVVLKNATLHPLDQAAIVGGSLWFDGGVIRGIAKAGEELQLPSDAEPLVVDATGKHAWPGWIAAHSQIGLIELGAVRQTVDTDEVNDMSPEALAGVAVNPDSAAIPVARGNGVLTACVFPIGGEIPGRASVMQFEGWTNEEMAVLADAGVVVDWPALPDPRGRRGRGGRGPGMGMAPGASENRDPEAATKKARERIEETFARALAWGRRKENDATTPHDLQCAALQGALRRERTTFVLADEIEEIESALAWTQRQQLRAVIVGGRDALLCADQLVELRVPVILTGVHKLPRRDDSDYDAPFRLPARLAERGVTFCIATGEEFAHERNLPWHAATAAAFGLDRERAVAAISRDAAEILGVGDKLGTLTVGKRATLLLTDGDPLELTTRIERAWIEGRETDLRSKQTELAKKYRQKHAQPAAGK